MDFKSLLNKLDSMEAPVATPAAPKLEQAVQLNEDAQLRVLSGRTTYVAEAKKKKDEEMAEEMKVGDSKKTAKGGTVTKTATGIKHEKGDYSDDDYVAPKASKAAKSSSEKKGDREADAKQDKETKDYEKKNPGSVTRVKDGKKVESIDESSAAQKAAREKFMSMVKGKKKSVEESANTDDDAEAKKKKEEKKKKIAKIMDEGSKPDFLDMDKDGDKKEPMKKAVADKKAGPKKGVNPFAKVKEATAKCNHTVKGKSCPVHGLKECGGMYEASHQEKTTMKHVNASDASPKVKAAIGKAAKDIKPGVKGYKDRADALTAAGIKR
jgi:hypothetical protein